MALLNEILAFCPNDTGTNLETQAAYAADTNRTNGNQPGVASSMLNNKAIRQGTYIASQLAEFLKTNNNQSVLDNAVPAQLLAQLVASLKFFPPVITDLTSGSSATFNLTYIFIVATASATTAATYSDGTTTYTVVSTISSATVLYATGPAAPVLGGAAGTLTKTSGTGNSTITYYAVRAPVSMYIEMLGAGGGGGAGLTNDGAAGSADTTFGSATAGKANGGSASTLLGGTGGTASLGTNWTGIAVAGAKGGCGAGGGTVNPGAGSGGSSPYGGAGGGGVGSGVAGGAASTNSGSGGGGAASAAASSGGGGAGGFVRATLSGATLLSTFTYTIGTGGAGGAAGTSAGGNGAAGRIFTQQNYQ